MTIDEAARSLIGVPWAHQGRNPAVGIDCVGLLVLSVRACGIPVDDRTDYGRDPDGTLYAALCEWLAGPFTDTQPGDVVLIQFTARQPRHVAIVSEGLYGLTLIHADSKHGKVVEHVMDDRWAARIAGAWRIA